MASIFLPPDQTRLVTIAAHVDHGKTTLADSLIESNGIISERLAGTLRYLDFLDEERRRGITMRASAIGLKHRYLSPTKKQDSSTQKAPFLDLVVHLLDSPGHTDFSTEVSSSLQCCDGCLLVIDAVEGVCARTHQVIREAHLHELVPILVINKVDRLCTGLCLTPTEAYLRLRGLIETVNATCAAMLNSKQAEDKQDVTNNNNNKNSNNNNNNNNNSDTPMTPEEEHWTFEPSKGNVVFASALYGWGFTVPSLARSLFRSKTVSIKPVALKQCLFGDFKCKEGDKKVLKWKHDSSDDPLFAQYALQPIWEIYEGVATAAVSAGIGTSLFADGRILSNNNNNNNTSAGKQPSKIKADTPGMDQVLEIAQIGSTSKGTGTPMPSTYQEMDAVLAKIGASSEEAVLRLIMRRYRPLSNTVLDAVYEILPSPAMAASKVRSRALALANPKMEQEGMEPNPTATTALQEIRSAVEACNASVDVPAVAHICKFMAVDRSVIRDPQLGDEEKSVILGLSRVLSGTLKTGSDYYVMGPKHAKNVSSEEQKRQIRLYLLMGSSFLLVKEVPAGHLCAIQNLDDLQLKTATICESPYGMPLQGFDSGIRPLVKVNVESVDPADTYVLEHGLVKLSSADSAVEITATAKGERILACLGEIHLEQSILDLKNIYCERNIELRISDPIVEFGETTTWFEDELDFGNFLERSSAPLRQSTIPPYNEEEGLEFALHGRSRAILSGRAAAISLRVVPLPNSIYVALQSKKLVEEECKDDLLVMAKALGLNGANMDPSAIFEALSQSLCTSDESGNALVESKALIAGDTIKAVVSDAGEIHVAKKDVLVSPEEEPTVAPDTPATQAFKEVSSQIRKLGFEASSNPIEMDSNDSGAVEMWKKQMRHSAIAGFQMAVRAGPICEEPVRGILVVIEGVEVALTKSPDDESYKPAKLMTSGMVASAIRSGIRGALLTRPSRLLERHFRLTLHSSLEALGSLYSVLSRRRGKVLNDSMVDGTDLLEISAALPHAESFGLAPELFRQSSGQVTAPELVFSHWERLDEDPFWVPTSLEEREDFGENLQNGDISTGMSNIALNYIRKVRARKGLVVDSIRTVEAAEKQRTMKR
ncbi:unnamed protein product [Cylindrotheca closterium]|uniref:Tr-type G domain-containing protein n=1 Tax=Cylindrotheca closterium TaxID=2856 RepID=A0AAD2FIW8_9STRA|nr:unnamed protein product [Cylindrotheca closterium]